MYTFMYIFEEPFAIYINRKMDAVKVRFCENIIIVNSKRLRRLRAAKPVTDITHLIASAFG